MCALKILKVQSKILEVQLAATPLQLHIGENISLVCVPLDMTSSFAMRQLNALYLALSWLCCAT